MRVAFIFLFLGAGAGAGCGKFCVLGCGCGCGVQRFFFSRVGLFLKGATLIHNYSEVIISSWEI